jgi:hypothetical protein
VYIGLTVAACIAAVAEVEHDRHRVVHIAGAVHADYSHGALVRIVPQTADKIGAGEHHTGECYVHCSVRQRVAPLLPQLMISLTVRKASYRFYIL